VLVTGVQDLGSGANGTTDEQVSLRFSKIEWDYTPYDVTGQAGSTVKASWDRKTNQPFSSATGSALVAASRIRTVSKTHVHKPVSTVSAIGRARSVPFARNRPARLRRM